MAMKLALKDAGVIPDAVDYINAHGTSTPLGDLAETKAIKTIFGDHAEEARRSARTKSQLGHLLGASGGVEAVVTAHGDRPQPDPADDQPRQPRPGVRPRLRPAQGPRHARSRYAMSNSFGFGGHNASLLFKKI